VTLQYILPFSLGEALRFDFSAPSPADWLPVLYYGVAVTALAFLLWFSGLSRVPASTAGVFIGVLPVSAVVLSYVVLGEPFVWLHLVGVSCVLLAILLIARKEPVAPG
jgi:drug/metabolite transporter (DMT)-like permease